MPPIAVCPSAEQLQRLLYGRTAAPQADTLEAHVEQCTRCQQSLADLDGADELAQTARRVAGRPALAGSAAVQGMIERLARLSVPDSTGGLSNGADTSLDSGLAVESLLAPPQRPDEIGRLGPYRVLGVLGAGGMGVVFRAEDPQLGRLVALKVIKPRLAASATARHRFEREARTAAAVEHDHIVPIYQVGEDRGVPFLAFPLLKGETLDQRLQRETCLPPAEVIRLGREIAEGLAAAHARGLIHRDVKPANIFLEGDAGRVKILDFGLARAVAEVQEPSEAGEAAAAATLTHAGGVVGTPAYMAPEQARGGSVDGRTDLFSLGAVLYRMATGRVPFAGGDLTAVLAAQQGSPVIAPHAVNRRVPTALSRLILELLALDPDRRPASAQVVAGRLAALAHPGRRRAWVLSAASLLVVGVAGLVALASWPGRPDEAPADEPIAGVEFVAAGSYATGLNPRFLAVGDVNGDGALDLLIVNMGVRGATIEEHTDGSVSVLLGNGDGTFRPAVDYAVGRNASGICLADVDGDGHLDAVVANTSSHDVSVLLGNGDGTFRPGGRYRAGRHPCLVKAGDFNGDGKLDLAVSSQFHNGGINVLLGHGDGTFGPAVFYSTGFHAGPLALGDVNGDGRLDLIGSNLTSDTVNVLLGNGDGTFRAPLHHRLEAPRLIDAADFDGDGKLDLAVIATRNQDLHVLWGQGDGTFRATRVGTGSLLSTVADFNADGRLDVAGAVKTSGTAGRLDLQLGRGRRAWQSGATVPLDFPPMQVAAGDFNGDGRPDLAVTVDGTHRVHVLLNRAVVERLTVSSPPIRAGDATHVLVTAQDALGRPALGYAGTVRLHGEGAPTGLPASYTFTDRDQGAAAFGSIVFPRPGRFTVSATDTANPTLTATVVVPVTAREP